MHLSVSMMVSEANGNFEQNSNYGMQQYLSIRLNSFDGVVGMAIAALPASAVCEFLLSFQRNGLIFKPERVCIGDRNFENQLLLDLNAA